MIPLANPPEPDVPQPALGPLAQRIHGLADGQRLTVVGMGREGIREAIACAGGALRSTLLLDPVGPCTVPAILDRLLDDLADLALSRWPGWHDGDGPPVARPGPADGRFVSAPWLKAATRRAQAGQPPRFRHAAPEIEFVQLARAIDPAGVVLVAEIDSASAARAAPVIQVLEWCAGHGAVVVAALPTAPPEGAPYDRILYDACHIAPAPAPVRERFVPARARPHHASATERRVAAALQADAELQDSFCCNALVPLAGYGPQPRVDLLCRAHRVVVELDGPEHRGRAAYAQDRHRDYALLAGGYLVLRITNEQVEVDLAAAIEKIRTVVRLRSQPREIR